MSEYQDSSIVCAVCEKLFDVPIYLPCQHSICKIHLKQESLIKKNKIECPICKTQHDVSNKSKFEANFYVRAMLETELHLSNDEKKVKNNLNAVLTKIQKLYDETKSKQLDFELECYKHFEEIRRQIDLEREELKEKIDNFALSLIELTKKTEKIYKDKLSILKSLINPFELEELNVEIKEIFRNPSFNNEDLKKLETKNQSLIKSLQKNVEELKFARSKMKLCSFSPKESSPEIMGDLCLNPISKNLISASSDHTVRIWSLDSFECIRTLSGHTDAVFFADVIQGNILVTGSRDRLLMIYDLEKNKLIKTIDNGGKILCLKVLSESNLIAIGSLEEIKIWNIQTEQNIAFKAHSTTFLRNLTTNACGNLISAAQETSIKIWDISHILKNPEISNSTPEPICKRLLTGHLGPVICLKVINNDILASGSKDKTIKLWDMGLGICVITLIGHRDFVFDLDLTDDGRLISCSFDKTIKIWNIETGENTKTLNGHDGEVSSVINYQDDMIISGDAKGDIKIWNTKTGLCIKTINKSTSGLKNLILKLNIF